MWYYNGMEAAWKAGWKNDEGSAPINTWIHDGYTGQWKNDLRHGTGQRVYHSEHSAGHKDYGVYQEWTETEIHDGEWKKGYRHGHGKETTSYSDNQKDLVIEWEWENGRAVPEDREVEHMSWDDTMYGRGGRGGM